jgi:3-oxoadipate enol-lactonase
MPHADVAGRALHYVRDGEGPPLLLVQGMSGHGRHWGDRFLGLLHRDFDVIAYDHRGVGGSDRIDPSAPLTIRDLADDAAGLLDALGLERAHVLGISMGGMVAQELALSHPDRVDRLVLGCTYAGGPGSVLTTPEVGQRLAAGWTSGDREQALRTGFEVNVSAAYAADEGNFAAFRETALDRPVPVPVILAQVQAIGGWHAQDRLAGVRAPTLVVHGTEDQMLVADNGRLIAQRIPGARLVELEGVGHLFWLERPEEVVALVRDHLLGAG